MNVVRNFVDILEPNSELDEMKQATEIVSEPENRIDAVETKSSRIDTESLCDFCLSDNLRRTGIRPNPNIGMLGQKQAVFHCRDCNKETYKELPL